MTNDQDRDRQGKVSEEESTESVCLKRRRLVKGLASAAPGIFTLYSGTAFALTSAAQRCIFSDRANFDGNSKIATDNFFADVYQRGTLTQSAIEIKGPGNITKWLAGVPDSGGNLHWYELLPDGVSWNQSDQEWTLCGTTGGPNPKRKFEPPGANCGGSWQEQDGTVSAHSLFCVDDEGNVVSAYPEQCGTQTPVTRSCWASIDPGAPDPTDRGGWW